MDWDPTPGRVGLDWLGRFRQGGVRLDHPLRAVAARVPSTVTETVTAVATHVVNVAGSPTITCDVYDPATPPGSTTTATYQPNEDVSGGFTNTGGTWAGSPTDTSGNRYTNVDETSASSVDYLLHTTGTTGGSYPAAWAFRVNSTTDPFGAGNHTVSAVRVRIRASFGGSGISTHQLRLYYTSGGTDYEMSTAQTVSVQLAAVAAQTFTFTLTTNPATNAPFTEAEIAALDATTSFKLTSNITISTNTAQTTKIEWVSVEVDHRPQPLIATGSAVATTDGYLAITFGSSFSKTSGQDWIFQFRRSSVAGTATIRTLDSGSVMPAGHTSHRPTLDAVAAVEDFGDELTEVIPLSISISGVLSVDSQPYSRMDRQAVDASNTVVQRITRPSTATVGWLALIAASSRSVVPAAPLLAKVKNSGGTQQGGTATFGTELVEDAPLTPRVLDGTMASTVSLTNATQYQVELTSTAPEGEGWDVIILQVVDDEGDGDSTAGFGSTTDYATLNGSGWTYFDRDVALVQGTVPTAPAGFSATPSLTGVGSNTLAWTATSLGGSFERYEVERLDPDGTTWRTIAHGLTEATATYSDYACRRSVAETYRIRVRHDNGTVSLPSSSDDATCTETGSYLIAPAATSLNHAVELNPGATFSRARQRIEEARYGDNYLSVTKGRRRGVVLTGTVDTTGEAGWLEASEWAFDIEDADTELVLVNDVGERWIVDVQFDDGTIVWSAGDSGDWQQIGFRAVEKAGSQTIVEF